MKVSMFGIMVAAEIEIWCRKLLCSATQAIRHSHLRILYAVHIIFAISSRVILAGARSQIRR